MGGRAAVALRSPGLRMPLGVAARGRANAGARRSGFGHWHGETFRVAHSCRNTREEVWLNGTAFIILLDAPQHPAVSDAISAQIGHPQFSTIAVSPPPPPEALPNTGSGGLGDATNVSARVWLFVAGSFFLVAVLGYAVTSGGRGRLWSP